MNNEAASSRRLLIWTGVSFLSSYHDRYCSSNLTNIANSDDTKEQRSLLQVYNAIAQPKECVQKAHKYN